MAVAPTDWVARLWAKTDVVPGLRPTPCWVGTGRGTQGYTVVGIGTKAEGGRKVRFAHRVAYARYRGPIPEGLEVDHLCRNRRCWNPFHMELVTRAENIRRGAGFGGALRPTATDCRRGHALVPENLYRRPDGRETCRQCHRDRCNRYAERKRAA